MISHQQEEHLTEKTDIPGAFIMLKLYNKYTKTILNLEYTFYLLKRRICKFIIIEHFP
jgi:hypothetical protein